MHIGKVHKLALLLPTARRHFATTESVTPWFIGNENLPLDPDLSASLVSLNETVAMMLAIPAPQLKPPMAAFSIFRASIIAIMSAATTKCWPFRAVFVERKRVVP